MDRFLLRIVRTDAPVAALLIRIAVGAVFLFEGIQKFLYPTVRGVGRFTSIGIPYPEFSANFVGVTEIVAGILILIGLLTRFASILLAVNMLVAIISTKIPILLGYGFWGFSLRKLSSYGFWSMAHESRTDLAMLLGSLFLLVVGAGKISIDYWLMNRRKSKGLHG